ncbi:phasin family protein [Amorphus sp. 3PC139-8]|uniref:phasin family protein n=1 Tax=Amorphus sp. 3PC139-8 TaxID=2735676 RepID=UPI00345C8D04
MSDQKQQETGARAFADVFDFRPMFAENVVYPGPFFTLWKRMAVDVPLTVASEALRFAGHRLEAQAELYSELAKCGTLSEVIDAQSTYMQDTAGDVSAATSKMMEEAQAVISREAV